jgi:hypothetical protein
MMRRDDHASGGAGAEVVRVVSVLLLLHLAGASAGVLIDFETALLLHP